MLFADVIVDISHEKLDRTFQYKIPSSMEEDVFVGIPVQIPFGVSNRLISGFVVSITDKPSWDLDKLKEIYAIELNKIPIESELIRLAGFIREQYGATMNHALKTVIPVKEKKKQVENRRIRLQENYVSHPELLESLIRDNKRMTAKIRLLEALREKKELSYYEVTHGLKISTAMLRDMEQKQWIEILSEMVYRDPLKILVDYDENAEGIEEPELNPEQQKVIRDVDQSGEKVHLLHGITGSGKTRVYIELIRSVVAEGKQAIVMIPEISLTYQTVKRFFDVFGSKVSIINSKLSAGERYDQFERAKNGDISIIIGPRSAVFTPFSNLGIIIIDEEHENSYKSENVPRYHAREVAIFRAGLHDAKVVLGSATPSIDAFYRAMQNQYVLHTLCQRAAGGCLAKVSVVDLRKELEEGNKSIFSSKLNELILDRLQKKQQIMLFINRRGYAGFVSCRSCGHVMRCPHCDVSLTYHNQGILHCHYCGYQIPMPKVCPECSSKYIARFGTGTEKVEEMVKIYYPSARVLRMDADTTSKKGGHELIIKKFANREADILVGTQMIVKGHDFPDVTLIGVIAADLSLYASDYRASERTFALLTQAAGRAGRSRKEAEAVIQTYNPENFSIQAAANQNYHEFYEKEILYRTLMDYPPVTQMMAVLITSDQEQKNQSVCEWIKGWMEKWKDEFIVIGPAPANLAKLNDVYRNVMYVKHADKQQLIMLKNILEAKLKTLENMRVDVSFDLNPLSGY